jgi:predicted O-methyltransferase YrrM
MRYGSVKQSQALNRIEEMREKMLGGREPLVDDSLGASRRGEEAMTVADACRSSKKGRQAHFLYLLVREFGSSRAVELGTNVGISAAYIAAALRENGDGGTLTTLEGSPYRMRVARDLHTHLRLDNVRYCGGNFDDTLANILADIGPLDFAFIDGNHNREPTLNHFRQICEHASEDAVLVFDDIRFSEGMKSAWNVIRQDAKVALALDLGSLGLCVVGEAASGEGRRHFSIRTALRAHPLIRLPCADEPDDGG